MNRNAVIHNFLKNEHIYKAYVSHNMHKFNYFTEIWDVCVHAASSVFLAVANGKFDNIEGWDNSSKYIMGVYKNTIKKFCEFNARDRRDTREGIERYINRAKEIQHDLKDVFEEVEMILERDHKPTHKFWLAAKQHIPDIITRRFIKAQKSGSLKTQLKFQQSRLGEIGKIMGISRSRVSQHKEIIIKVYNDIIKGR